MLPPPPPSSNETKIVRPSPAFPSASSSSPTVGAAGAVGQASGRIDTRHSPDGMVWLFTPPVLIERGMFRGKEMRFALNVAQEPVLGRRKTEKDRRPLGPAPIVRLRIVECRRRNDQPRNAGHLSGGKVGESEWDEDEVDPSSIEPSHLLCAAEIGPPTNPPSPGPPAFNVLPPGLTGASANMAAISLKDGQDKDAEGDIRMRGRDSDERTPVASMQDIGEGIAGPGPATIRSTDLRHDNGLAPPTLRRRVDESSPTPTPPPGPSSRLPPLSVASSESEGDDEGWAGPSREKRRRPDPSLPTMGGIGGGGRGRNLFGTLHVAGVRVPAIDGSMGLWFLFTDLSVRREGRYSLRFRCFDLTALDFTGNSPAPLLAHCQSQTFKIYSPRQVPPLPKPNELAEHFAKQGFKLNTRKNERTVSSPPPVRPPSLPETSETSARPDIRPIQPLDLDSSGPAAREQVRRSGQVGHGGGGGHGGSASTTEDQSQSASSTSESVARLSTASSGSLGGASSIGGDFTGAGKGAGAGVGGMSGSMGITPPLTPLDQTRRKG
ncbi:hypothetical protein IAR55_006177 [Kwoniella newhampshirensis]|uniref:Velvet domain-containing protein n=1 Tax=Kwoniella newhampshirensis TaxID=1651941 RepID=A0AAW0YFU5_9TREE